MRCSCMSQRTPILRLQGNELIKGVFTLFQRNKLALSSRVLIRNPILHPAASTDHPSTHSRRAVFVFQPSQGGREGIMSSAWAGTRFCRWAPLETTSTSRYATEGKALPADSSPNRPSSLRWGVYKGRYDPWRICSRQSIGLLLGSERRCSLSGEVICRRRYGSLELLAPRSRAIW